MYCVLAIVSSKSEITSDSILTIDSAPGDHQKLNF